MKKVSTWEVVWSRRKPFVVYRISDTVFKVFKAEFEPVIELRGRIDDLNYSEAYPKLRKILCDDLSLDGSACDAIRGLYLECFEDL